jgi:glycerol-3-phosphate cytidylyltransferase
MSKRIMVDMSATLIHHGHIRLLKKASKHGAVVVGLTTDLEIYRKKGYHPELSFEHRKEILESIKYVTEVVPTPWLIDSKTLDKFNIDILVHGDDNTNSVLNSETKIFPRTKDVSSSDIRANIQKTIIQVNNQKLMLTPGPAAVLYENVEHLKPVFGRGDKEYTLMAESVIDWIRDLSGQDEVIMQQGSSTLALELAGHSFVKGKVLLISTGYYSDRLEALMPNDCNIVVCKYADLGNIQGNFDWVLCAYTETSTAFKLDIKMVKEKTNKLGAKLYIDATGSIGLEEDHNLGDVLAFSSCKGLFGLTGASFIAHKNNLIPKPSNYFYFNMKTQRDKMVTGPYHAIASLYGVMNNHSIFRERVRKSKAIVLKKWNKIVRDNINQPLLCTYLEGNVIPLDNNTVLYNPRSKLTGSVICHLGEIHSDQVNIDKRIKIEVC